MIAKLNDELLGRVVGGISFDAQRKANEHRTSYEEAETGDWQSHSLTALTAKSREVHKPGSISTYEYQYNLECIL